MSPEIKMAMQIAINTWTGTSMADGAFTILDRIYNEPHTFVDGGDGKCCRCGRKQREFPHT